MSRATTRATAALLCGVVLVALGLAFVGLPDAEAPAESLSVRLDFDTFSPGVTQTRTSDVVIPVASRVTDASIEQSADSAMSLDTVLTICSVTGCEPLVPGLEVATGPHTLTVEATLADSTQTDTAPGAVGSFTGQIRIVETHQSAGVDTSLLVGISAIGLAAIAIGAFIVSPRRRATT
ncbi:MAG: hypothetical protein WBP59_03125 [Ilumatobacteraceae bacterium]